MDKKQYKQTLATYLTGVTVVTCIDEQQNPIGFTANSFTSVSLEPPLILVCLAHSSVNCQIFASSQFFAVNILAANQQSVAETFSMPVAERFAAVDWRFGDRRSPILSGVAAWLECEMYQQINAGDHMIMIGRVLGYENLAHSPLGYMGGDYIKEPLNN